MILSCSVCQKPMDKRYGIIFYELNGIMTSCHQKCYKDDDES